MSVINAFRQRLIVHVFQARAAQIARRVFHENRKDIARRDFSDSTVARKRNPLVEIAFRR